MEMRVNPAECTGCGLCATACSTGAIHLSNSIAILDQTTCTQCQACVDVCPVGAIAVIELPVVAKESAGVQPIREAAALPTLPVPSVRGPWVNAILSFASREILPRVVDAVIAALDRRLAQAQLVEAQVYLPSQNAELSQKPGKRRCYRRRSRVGRARH